MPRERSRGTKTGSQTAGISSPLRFALVAVFPPTPPNLGPVNQLNHSVPGIVYIFASDAPARVCLQIYVP